MSGRSSSLCTGRNGKSCVSSVSPVSDWPFLGLPERVKHVKQVFRHCGLYTGSFSARLRRMGATAREAGRFGVLRGRFGRKLVTHDVVLRADATARRALVSVSPADIAAVISSSSIWSRIQSSRARQAAQNSALFRLPYWAVATLRTRPAPDAAWLLGR